ncbi:DUF7109 family protein [Halomicrococcus gelatinilyticus]|uniref:DUF7109 family protein n=1 Tax=Halomicrococcus gelatinilyticus TaxID=1702103 RepID=UPI002E1121EC
MSRTRDELAGVVDLFGALTRAELAEGLAELAFKQGKSVDESAFDSVIDRAVEDYYLVEADHDDETVLVPGPVAFPSVPENGEDLPHIMDVPDRDVDRTGLGERTCDRLRSEAEAAAEAGDEERAGYLIDVSYDLEAWAPVDTGDVRERLDDV